MPRCPACVAENPDESEECWQCGYRFGGKPENIGEDPLRSEPAAFAAGSEQRRIAYAPKHAMHVGIGCMLVAAALTTYQTIQTTLIIDFPTLFAVPSLTTPIFTVIGSLLLRRPQLGLKSLGVGFLLYNGAILAGTLATALRGPGPDTSLAADFWINLATGLLGILALALLGYSLVASSSIRARTWSAVVAGGLYTVSSAWVMAASLRPQVPPEFPGMLQEEPLDLFPLVGFVAILVAILLASLYGNCWVTFAFGLTLPCCELAAIVVGAYPLAATTPGEFVGPGNSFWILGVAASVFGMVRARLASSNDRYLTQ